MNTKEDFFLLEKILGENIQVNMYKYICTSYLSCKWRIADALVMNGDEGRGKLR